MYIHAQLLWQILDYLFVIVHTSLILFNLTAWIWKRTRTVHFASVIITGGSWWILGLFYGIGYCPLTDWHYSVLFNMGQYNLPSSYIQYLVERLTSIKLSAHLVDSATLIAYFLVLVLSVYFNFFFSQKCKKKHH